MISSLLRVQWIQLRRDRAALASIFFLPIAFFSVTALIFGGMTNPDNANKITKVLIADYDRSDHSEHFLRVLREHANTALEVIESSQLARREVDAEVRNGSAPVALIVAPGFGKSLQRGDLTSLQLDIVYDGANPVARYVLNAAVQNAALRVLLQSTSESGSQIAIPGLLLEPGSGASPLDLVGVNLIDARPGENSIVLYYAAGIAVMFLLFSSVRAGGALLEERDEGTLERVLNTRASIGTLLVAKWLFFTIQGSVQIAAMFVWARLVFDADVLGATGLAAVVLMTLVTAGAASSFGVVLATLFRTRAQLFGISTIVILIMSALGGSMAPRFAMPPIMDTVALFTFNGWALDGYLKIFWYAAPSSTQMQTLLDTAPQIAVLTLLTCLFLCLARVLARAWEVQ